MIKVNLSYNPYRMKTVLEINGENAIKSSTYKAFERYINVNVRIPLQTWIDPIPHDDWKGFIPQIVQESGETKLELSFSGREIDFKDLERAIAAQNKTLGDNAVEVTYKKNLFISDKDLGVNIDKAVQEMLSQRFSDLVKASNSKQLSEKYKKLKESHRRSKSKEFKIIFAGLYSSGKSTLINALIGKELLPSANGTCTSKVCKIKHKKNVPFAEIQCIDRYGKIIVPLEKFRNSEEFTARFDEVCPINKPCNPPEIDEIEIYTDLSALYPDGFEDKFNLVFVDTPGTNSTIGNSNDVAEKHIDITVKAIQAKEKEMVIIVVAGQNHSDDSLKKLFDKIKDTVKQDCGGFNDRFLFVMNKCDGITYNGREGIKDEIKGYADSLNSNGQGSKESVITPRIFPVCAAPALAIKKGCTGSHNTETTEQEPWFTHYDDFSRKFQKKSGVENYELEDFCSTSEYVRDSLNKKLEELKGTDDKAAQILIHTGIPSVEESIKEYIERYAYPIKVRDLLSSFDSILSEVTGRIGNRKSNLSKAIEIEHDEEAKKSEAKHKRDEEKKRNQSLEKAKKEIKAANEKIQKIVFDGHQVAVLKHQAQLDLFDREEVRNVKDTYSSRSEAEKAVQAVENVLNDVFPKLECEFKKISQNVVNVAQGILNELNSTLETLENDGVFRQGDDGFDFTKTVAYQDFLKVDSLDDLSSQFKELSSNIGEKTTLIKNPAKSISYDWWQFFKKLGQLSEPDEIKKTDYETNFLLTKLDELKIGFNKQCDEIEKASKLYIEYIKNVILERQNEILDLVAESQMTIDQGRAEIKILVGNVEGAQRAKKQYEDDLKWMEQITKSIESVLSNNS